MPDDPASHASASLEIDLAGIATNWRLLKERVAPAQCTAVVKADGYGLGAVPVATELAAAGCRQFFVATIEEGLALREALGDPVEIAVLNGVLPGTAQEFEAHRLLPVLNDLGQVDEWRSLAGKHGALPAILQIDTGMARLGVSLRDFAALADDLRQDGAIRWQALMSHLACAEDPENPMNERQRSDFAAACGRFPGVPASLAASSGIFLGPEYHLDLVRPGAALYGVNPQPRRPNPMCQVVQLKAKILQVREIDRGSPVGYGAAHRMSAPGRLATVAAGYADGYLRSFGQRGSGRIGGKRVPLVGRVSMDLVIFDVTAVDPALARPGDMVELLGEEYGVDAAAADAGTIGYEILTGLGRRYHRHYRR